MITVRVDEELKEKIKKYPNVNWPDYIRKSLEQRIKEEEMREASEMMDRIAEKISPSWSGSREIRRWRDRDDDQP